MKRFSLLIYSKSTRVKNTTRVVTVGKQIYHDDGKIGSESIALDREALEILRAKIRLY